MFLHDQPKPTDVAYGPLQAKTITLALMKRRSPVTSNGPLHTTLTESHMTHSLYIPQTLSVLAVKLCTETCHLPSPLRHNESLDGALSLLPLRLYLPSHYHLLASILLLLFCSLPRITCCLHHSHLCLQFHPTRRPCIATKLRSYYTLFVCDAPPLQAITLVSLGIFSFSLPFP